VKRRDTKVAEQVEPEFITVKDAAKRYSLSAWSIRQNVYAGKLTAKRYGNRLLVEVASLRQLIANLPDAASTRAFSGERHHG
jgi:hypothetical protein